MLVRSAFGWSLGMYEDSIDYNLIHKQFITHESKTRTDDVKIRNNELYILNNNDYPCLHMFTQSGALFTNILKSDSKNFSKNLP